MARPGAVSGLRGLWWQVHPARMTTTDARQEAQGWLAQNFAGWVLALEPQVDSVGCTGVVLSIPVTDEIARVGGIVSGQALAVLADSAMVIACARHYREFRPVATTNLDLQFLRPATGERVRCAAMLVRAGRSLIFARAVLSADPSGKDVATATATYALP